MTELNFFLADNAGITNLNDMYVYSSETSTWQDLNFPSFGTAPSPRRGMGFVGTGGTLFVFGGAGNAIPQ